MKQEELHGTEIILLSDPRWLAFVRSQKDATIFHHTAWAGVLTGTYGYRPLVLTQTSVDKQIVAGIPLLEVRSKLTGRRFVSLPFTDHCPPLGQNATSLSILSSSLTAWRKSQDASLVEIRGEMPKATGVHPTTVAVRHVMPLEEDTDRVFRSFKRTQVQQRILKAQREGVQVRLGRSRGDLLPFYRLHLQTRRRLGAPVQPKRFLAALWEQLIEAGLGFVVFAYRDSKPIAGAVFLAWNDIVIYKYGASDPDYWRFRPNNLVLWTAIKWSCENGYRQFDFGRSDFDDQGLRNFKDGWGTTELPLVYSYFANSPPKRASDFSKRFVAKVIRHSPTIVCRGIGEVLYGHFG